MIVVLLFGFGKMIVILGLFWVLKNIGLKIVLGKVGLDYIDLVFYIVVFGEVCFNFDFWGMWLEFLVVMGVGYGGGWYFVVEVMMGLFDGVSDGLGLFVDFVV